jgi:hypothetical protein
MALTDNALRINTIANLNALLSPYLFTQIKVDGSGATDVVFPTTLDMSNVTKDSDFLGINLFSAGLLNLTLPIAVGGIQGQDNFRIDNFTALKKLISNDATKCVFSGNIGSLTALTDLKMNVSSARTPYILVTLSNCPNLVNVTITGSATYGITDIGNLGALRNLVSYRVTCSGVVQATTNNILSTLHTAKAAGCPLTTVFLTGTATPTGGTSNTDYLYLTGAGVSVTL